MPRFGGARCAASTGPYVFQGNPPWFGFRQFLFLVRWAAAVAYVLGGEAMVSFHHAMPFGATSSVLAWDQVGDLLCVLARRLLHVPVFRYVDDFFCPERPETMEHGMATFARLVRLLLGETAVAERKLEFGHVLAVLGIVVQPSGSGVEFRLCPKKVSQWLEVINEAIATGKLVSGSAQKLSGRLMWATQLLFHRVGRAMIKAIFAQKRSADGLVGSRLMRALLWWRDVLLHGVTEMRLWSVVCRGLCHLFVDAASTPARCAAVLFVDGRVLYTDGPPAACVMAQVASRNDKQIMSLVLSFFFYVWGCSRVVADCLLVGNPRRHGRAIHFRPGVAGTACGAVQRQSGGRACHRQRIGQGLRSQPVGARNLDPVDEVPDPPLGAARPL
jgi:hypothetical protein